jgi:predicted permease
MRTLTLDVRYGLRLLASNPGFTLVAVLTLALGIASTTTVFSWVDGILLHPFPGIAIGDRLAALERVTAGAPTGASSFSYPDYRDFRDHLKLVSGLAAHGDEVFSLGTAADGQPAWGEAVSSNYFEVLGVRPALGRVFTARECGDTPGACPVVVVSHQFWRDRLGGQPGAVGQSLRVNRRELTVIGVAPPEFRGTIVGLRYDLWTPLTMSAELGLGAGTLKDRGNRGLDVLACLAPGVTLGQARTEAAALAERLAAIYPRTNQGIGATVVSVGQMRRGAAALLRAPLRILLAVSLVVLLIVCANVANLLLARTISRGRELSLRMALGASRTRLARQLTTETLLLAGAGALAGLPMAFWIGDLLPLLVPRIGVPVAVAFELNPRVLGFTVLACVTAALLSSVAPALWSLGSDVNEALKEGGRGGAQGRQSHRARGLLVVSEVALACLALVGAGLFLRSFENARRIHPGFDRDRVLLARFHMSGSRYSAPQMHQFFQRLQERMRSAPGVAGASYGDYAPLGSNSGPYATVQVEGYTPAIDDKMMVSENLVAPGYLATLRIPLLEGRDFTAQDTPDRPPVLIVSQAFARKYYAGASPLGRRVLAWGKWRTIVGMARDSKHFHPTEPDRPYFYSPLIYSGNSSTSIYFLVRTAGDPLAAVPMLRREAAELDPESVAMQPMPLKEWTEVTLFPQKVAACLLGALSGLALLLAAVGLYSVMAYAVTQRTHEFGIRMALGAPLRNVLGDVLRQGLGLTAAGLLVGLLAATVLTRLVKGMLVNVSAVDPLTYAAAACFLALVAVVACAVPARRAATVDPMVALRQE